MDNKKLIKRVFIIVGIISISIILLAASLVFVARYNMNQIAHMGTYDVAGESIPSITSVVGERSVSYRRSGISNGVRYQEFVYWDTDSSQDDIEKYITHLSDEYDFIISKDLEMDKPEGEVVLWKRFDSGKEVMITISYVLGRYDVFIENT